MRTDATEPNGVRPDAGTAAGAILDVVPALVWIARPDGSTELFNRTWLEYTGLAPEATLDWGWTVSIHPYDRDLIVAHWRSLLASGEPGEVEVRMRRFDGEYRWFQSRSVPVRDGAGRIVRWSTLLTDIEDLKRAQEALRASAQGFRLVVDSIPGLVYTMTPDGAVEMVNRQILEYFGRTLDDLKGWAAGDAVHPDDLPRVVAAWQRSVETGAPYEIEHRLRRADGEYRWFHLRAVGVRDADGRIVRWYGLLTDVDDRKRAQRRLRAAIRARYEAALAERTRIAREMHDGLLQDITGITLQLGAALPHARTSPDTAERLERILESVQRAGRDAREAVVGMRARSESADLAGAVQEEARRLTVPAGLALSVSVRGPARPVPATVRDAAVSIVHEAVTNVVRHAGARGVEVAVVFRSGRLHLFVRDDGRGLTAPAEASTAAARLGLVGMRERAASIGAGLRVSSVPGRGTTLRLDVPIAG